MQLLCIKTKYIYLWVDSFSFVFHGIDRYMRLLCINTKYIYLWLDSFSFVFLGNSWLACCWLAVCPGSSLPISMRWCKEKVSGKREYWMWVFFPLVPVLPFKWLGRGPSHWTIRCYPCMEISSLCIGEETGRMPLWKGGHAYSSPCASGCKLFVLVCHSHILSLSLSLSELWKRGLFLKGTAQSLKDFQRTLEHST